MPLQSNPFASSSSCISSISYSPLPHSPPIAPILPLYIFLLLHLLLHLLTPFSRPNPPHLSHLNSACLSSVSPRSCFDLQPPYFITRYTPVSPRIDPPTIIVSLYTTSTKSGRKVWRIQSFSSRGETGLQNRSHVLKKGLSKFFTYREYENKKGEMHASVLRYIWLILLNQFGYTLQCKLKGLS